MKPVTACVECRKGKRKCKPSSENAACSQCLKRGLSCSLTGQRRLSQTRPPALFTAAQSSVTPLLSQEIKENLVKLYLCRLHNSPQTLFHEQSLLQSVRDGTVSRNVLLGILGLSARFSSDYKIRSQGKAYASEARRCLKQNIDNACLENIQACILVGTICSADEDVEAESIFYGIANTMAQILKLSDEDESSDAITRETKRRVWCSLYMVDTWSSAGIDIPRRLLFRGSGPQLPMDERLFNRLQSGDSEPAKDVWKPGLWAYMVILAQIFSRIQDFNQRIVQAEEDQQLIEEESQNLSSELENFAKNLPNDVQYTAENLNAHVANSLGRPFVALHLGHHHYSTLLYYHYLDNHKAPNALSRRNIIRCKYHAAAFSDIVRASLANPDAEAVHNIVGHMTVVSSSVLVHTLLFGEDYELLAARERLEINFQLLIRLREFWPSVESMLKRLIIFQNSCIEAASPQPHKIDKWIIKFLLQHALVLDSRQPVSHGDVPFNKPTEYTDSASSQEFLKRSRVTENIIKGAQVASGNTWESATSLV